MNEDNKSGYEVYVAVMELAAEVRDQCNAVMKMVRFGNNYDDASKVLDNLYARLDEVGDFVEQRIHPQHQTYKTYLSFLTYVNNTINALYLNVDKLKLKAAGGKYGFSENKKNINAYHDAYDELMDSANNLQHLFAQGVLP